MNIDDRIATKLIIQRIENICKKENRIKNKKITPYKISKNGGLNPRTLNNILNGINKDARMSTVQKVCFGLNVSLREFFDDDLFNSFKF